MLSQISYLTHYLQHNLENSFFPLLLLRLYRLICPALFPSDVIVSSLSACRLFFFQLCLSSRFQQFGGEGAGDTEPILFAPFVGIGNKLSKSNIDVLLSFDHYCRHNPPPTFNKILFSGPGTTKKIRLV